MFFESRLDGDRTGRPSELLNTGRRFPTTNSMKSRLRYEVAICILTGDNVLINGPFTCERWNDIQNFRNSLMSYLSVGKRVKADYGYIEEAP